jgi:hypothetical protein
VFCKKNKRFFAIDSELILQNKLLVRPLYQHTVKKLYKGVKIQKNKN